MADENDAPEKVFRKDAGETIERYRNNSRFYHVRAALIRWVIIISSGFITICAGFALWTPGKATIVMNSIALVLSAVVAAANAFEAYYKHEQLYVGYKVGLARIQVIIRDLEMAKAKGKGIVPPNEFDSLWSNYCAVISETEDSWAQTRKQVSEEPKKENQGLE